MKRKVYSDLLEWKDRPDRKPLILDGVRQCGKTYILKEFGRNEFDSLAYLDLERRRDLYPLFGDDLDPKRIVTKLGTALGRRIVPGRTLIVLDEVQACPRALTAMKYFCEEMPEQHVVCAGSLLGILTSRTDSFPVGKVDRLRMYPMSFLEFLDACGEGALCDMLCGLSSGCALDEAFRGRVEDLLRQYYVVGGLPDVVSSWVDNHSEAAVTRKLRTIERDYRDDFAKHAPKDLQKLTDIWDSIPVQLGKENRKFMYGQVRDKGRASDLSDALRWIVDAGLAYTVPLVRNQSVPLKGVCEASEFKVYLCDIGLMRVMSGKKASFVRSRDPMDRLYKGAMTENFVLCQMLSGGLEEAFYWSDGRNEVDFLIDGSDGPVPVEVKSESSDRHASLDRYMEKHSPGMAVLTSMDPGSGGAVTGVHLSCAELIPSYAGIAEVRRMMSDKGKAPYVRSFSSADWSAEEEGFVIRVRAREHRIGMPSFVQVYRSGEGGFSEVRVSKMISSEGDVTIGSTERFDGFVSMMRSFGKG